MLDLPLYRPVYDATDKSVSNTDLSKIVNSSHVGQCTFAHRDDCGIEFNCPMESKAKCRNCLVSKYNLKTTKAFLKKLTIERLKNVR